MKNNKNILYKQAFTLIEMLVAMTIFAIIMVSVMMIYASAVQAALKVDINREMQQNIKSVIENIADDVREHGIKGVSIGFIDTYDFGINGYKLGTRLETGTSEYKLYGYKSGEGEKLIDAEIRDNIFCQELKNICFIMLIKDSVVIGPLSNSKMSISNLSFYASEGEISKITISFVARAAIKNGLRPDLVKGSKIVFQTTISERNLSIK